MENIDAGVRHGSFTLELGLPARPSEVFAAYAELPVRKKWFRMPGTPDEAGHLLDFRVGGGESVGGGFAAAGGAVERMAYRSHFLDIVPDRRIVLTYTFELDGLRRWTSLVTIELSGQAEGSALRHTEQYAFLERTGDGEHDVPHLKGGTQLQFNGLIAALRSG